MREEDTPLPPPPPPIIPGVGCGCIYCLWRRALAKALMEKMDAEMMAGLEPPRRGH